ncbi:unnamed protein product [Rhizophagus irregularis]|nr:unnamed protein product [Rhizophagus irregularis]
MENLRSIRRESWLLRDKLETANNTIQDLEDEMDRMEAELREEFIRCQDNEQLIVELNAMNHDYQEDLAFSQETIAELRLQIDNQKRELTELTEDLDKARSDWELKTKNIEQDEKIHEELVSDLKEKLNMSDAKIVELTAINELIEKLSAAQQQISDLNMTIQERDADLQYVRQQLSNQTGRNKDTTERYSKEQERLRAGTIFRIKRTKSLEHENEIKHLNNQRTKLNENYHLVKVLVLKPKKSSEIYKCNRFWRNNLTQEKKATYSNETQYRDQIIERNKLLMTIYQYLDNIMSDSANKQSNYPKPSANFGLFNEHLLSKLKTLTHVHNAFDRRAKEIDNRWQEQYESLKNQMDIKLPKRNQGELEAARNMNEELTDQLSIMREQIDELKTANSRAEEAESKLRESERRARTIESKMKEEERKWTGRMKDSEYREKQSEERLKVEKQGAKEKVESLIDNIKDLETQIQALNRRNNQLQELISIQKASMEVNNESKAIAAKAEHTFSMLNEQLREQLEEKNKTIETERKNSKNYKISSSV